MGFNSGFKGLTILARKSYPSNMLLL